MTSPPAIKIRDVFPDNHFLEVEEHFEFSNKEDRARGRDKLIAALAKIKSFYVLCFTNRCGSNHLGECLASDGRVGFPSEGLNFDTVIAHSMRQRFTSFDEYLAWLIQTQVGSAGVFGIKASPAQLIGLHNRGILRLAGAKLHMVHALRREVMAQAVSMLIASRTRRWTSKQPGIRAEIKYNPDELLGMAESICRQNAIFTALFELLQLDPVRVPYDKMQTEPDKLVRRVGRVLGVANLKLVPEKLSLEKQANELNAELLNRLEVDYSLAPAGGRVNSTKDD
jgi:trehalose 2-sulfotransferase